eukprot:3879132-Ditylum_brightwellii.AAC.1
MEETEHIKTSIPAINISSGTSDKADQSSHGNTYIPNTRNKNSNTNEATLLITKFPSLSIATVKKKIPPGLLTFNKITPDHVQK